MNKPFYGVLDGDCECVRAKGNTHSGLRATVGGEDGAVKVTLSLDKLGREFVVVERLVWDEETGDYRGQGLYSGLLGKGQNESDL